MKKLFATAVLLAALAAAATPAPACDSTNFNFFAVLESPKYKTNLTSFGPAGDSISRFASFSTSAIKEAFAKSGSTGEIKVMIKYPVLLDPGNFNLSDTEREAFSDSIENEIRRNYATQEIRVLTRRETAALMASIGQTDENFIMTPEIAKQMHSKLGIFAYMNILAADMNSWNSFKFDLKGQPGTEERRDVELTNYSQVSIRYKITRCADGEIIWIDEVPGTTEDIYYFSAAERGRILNFKKECVNYSVLSNSSCAN